MKLLFTILTVLGLVSCTAQSTATSEQYKDLSREEAKIMLQSNSEIQIIDVRTNAEVARGMIENAKQIDISNAEFENEIEKLDKQKPVLVYCASGMRSKRAQNIMKEKGFTEVHNLLGGYNAWR